MNLLAFNGKIILESLKISINISDEGVMEIAFPNAEVIESDNGPMMGFRCDVNSAMWIAGAIISSAFEYAARGEEDEDDE